MSLVDVLNEDARWAALGLPELAETAARATLLHLGLRPGRFEISLLACNDARIAILNADFRGKPQATNVLSWPSEERGAGKPGTSPDLPQGKAGAVEELGDIAIAYETCQREAEAAGKTVKSHACHLLVHGVLHLLGYDHMSDEDAALMEGLEVEILATLGHDDPY